MMQGNTYNTVFPPPVGITAITSSPFEIEPVLNSVCPKTLFKTSRGFLEPVSTPQEMYNCVGSVMHLSMSSQQGGEGEAGHAAGF